MKPPARSCFCRSNDIFAWVSRASADASAAFALSRLARWVRGFQAGEDLIGLDVIADLDPTLGDLAVGPERDVDLCLSLDIPGQDHVERRGRAPGRHDPDACHGRIDGRRLTMCARDTTEDGHREYTGDRT